MWISPACSLHYIRLRGGCLPTRHPSSSHHSCLGRTEGEQRCGLLLCPSCITRDHSRGSLKWSVTRDDWLLFSSFVTLLNLFRGPDKYQGRSAWHLSNGGLWTKLKLTTVLVGLQCDSCFLAFAQFATILYRKSCIGTLLLITSWLMTEWLSCLRFRHQHSDVTGDQFQDAWPALPVQ